MGKKQGLAQRQPQLLRPLMHPFLSSFVNRRSFSPWIIGRTLGVAYSLFLHGRARLIRKGTEQHSSFPPYHGQGRLGKVYTPYHTTESRAKPGEVPNC